MVVAFSLCIGKSYAIVVEAVKKMVSMKKIPHQYLFNLVMVKLRS